MATLKEIAERIDNEGENIDPGWILDLLMENIIKLPMTPPPYWPHEKRMEYLAMQMTAVKYHQALNG